MFNLPGKFAQLRRLWRLPAAVAEVNQRNLAVDQGNQTLASSLLGLHRRNLKDRFGVVVISTCHPVALESPDHLEPWGTAHDNSRNVRFNARLIALMQDEMMSVLDLGCSGGGQVRSFIEQGYLAVGIEGSDLSARQLRAEWLTIPDYLFTADITKPFRLQTAKGREGMRFGVVTAWEVIEHIAEADLPQVLANVDAHLMPGGLVIMSVSPKSDIINGVELHQTVKPRAWWEAFLTASGWTNHPKLVSYFDGDFVRAEPNAPGSFHVVLSRRGEVPRLSARLQHLAATAN